MRQRGSHRHEIAAAAAVCNPPQAAYLKDVLTSGLPKIEPTGCYHFGDVISREHYKLFLLRRARFFTHSFAELQSEETRAQLFASAKDRCFEQELFFGLQLAERLPGVAATCSSSKVCVKKRARRSRNDL